MSQLNCLALNVCGLNSKINEGILEVFIQKYHFVLLSEMKTDFISPDQLPGFVSFVSEKKVSGGKNKSKSPDIAILVKESIFEHLSVIKETASSWILWIEVGKNAKNTEFVLGSVYIPRETSPYYDETIFDTISEDILFLNSKYDVPLILMGDFNARTGTKKRLR